MQDKRVLEFQKWLENQEKKSGSEETQAGDVTKVLQTVAGAENNLRAIRALIDTATTTGNRRELKKLFSRTFRILGGE